MGVVPVSDSASGARSGAKIVVETSGNTSVESQLFTKNRKIYHSEESALKLIYMAIMQSSKRRMRPIKYSEQVLNHFAILFEDRLPPSHRY